jgi:hypothetical protein
MGGWGWRGIARQDFDFVHRNRNLPVASFAVFTSTSMKRSRTSSADIVFARARLVMRG